jgi:hypothetical protein
MESRDMPPRAVTGRPTVTAVGGGDEDPADGSSSAPTRETSARQSVRAEGCRQGATVEHWPAAVSQCGISIMSRLDLPPRLHYSRVRHRAHRAARGHARATPPSDLKGGHS